jgi:hypothetical protein
MNIKTANGEKSISQLTITCYRVHGGISIVETTYTRNDRERPTPVLHGYWPKRLLHHYIRTFDFFQAIVEKSTPAIKPASCIQVSFSSAPGSGNLCLPVTLYTVTLCK